MKVGELLKYSSIKFEIYIQIIMKSFIYITSFFGESIYITSKSSLLHFFYMIYESKTV